MSEYILTLPAGATAYAGNDVLGDSDGNAILNFKRMGKVYYKHPHDIMITSIEMQMDINAVPAGMNGFHLRLYNQAPAAISDNDAWDLVTADRDKYLGRILLANPVDEGGTLFKDNDQINKQVSLLDENLYVVLQTLGGFTPTPSTVIRLRIHFLEVN